MEKNSRNICAIIFSHYPEHSRGNFNSCEQFILEALQEVSSNFLINRIKVYKKIRKAEGEFGTMLAVQFFKGKCYLSPDESYYNPDTLIVKRSTEIEYEPQWKFPDMLGGNLNLRNGQMSAKQMALAEIKELRKSLGLTELTETEQRKYKGV